jgi:hypothetical protein
VQSEVGPVTIRRSGEVVVSETTLAAIGPHVVVVTTALPDLGTQITTTYVGADDADTIAIDLCLPGTRRATVAPRTIRRESVPVTHARRQCLLDHARHVMNQLRVHDRAVWTVDVSDAALDGAGSV